MNIVLITGDPKAGLAQYTSQLAIELSAKHEVTVLTPRGPIEDYLKGHVEYRILDSPTRIASFKLIKFFQIASVIKKINPDIVHIQSVPPWVGLALPLLKKYPVVITVHDPEIHPGARGYHILRTANWYMTKKATHLITHGKFLKQTLIKQGIEENKITVIPHPDYSFFTRFKQPDLKPENAILFFGRIAQYKGLEYLFKAAPLVLKRFPDFKIIIAGRNGLSNYEELTNYKDKFEIHNEYISDKKIAELFQRAKIVVLPYIQASQSGVIHIAYAFKVPVVATNVGSIPEIVEDGVTGLLVPPKDSQAIAKAIIDVLANEERRAKMGENAYQKMKREMSWEKAVQKTISVYNNTLRKKNDSQYQEQL